MASFGHLAVGMMAGRLQRGAPRVGTCSTAAEAATQRVLPTLAFALLGILPDGDLLLVALGVSDSNATVGHRGGSHSLLTAIALGVCGGLLARRLGWGAIRTALAVTLAVGSHGILDAFGQGGRGIPLFWPVSGHRFMAPSSWRILPDAPRGMKLITWDGLGELAQEFVYFLPLTIYAVMPAWRERRRARAAARALEKTARASALVDRNQRNQRKNGSDTDRRMMRA